MSADDATRARVAELCSSLGLGGDPASVQRALLEFYDGVDAEIGASRVAAEVPCHAGCDACCREAVFVSSPEFLVVAMYLIETRRADARGAIVREMRAIATRFADELELLETIGPGVERDEVAARVKFPCPLLTANGACSIHAVRELNARTFGVSIDELHDTPYACALAAPALTAIQRRSDRVLIGARDLRRRLVESVPGTERVHVYPWWFARFGHFVE